MISSDSLKKAIHAGFTLIELLLVISIVGLLASVILSSLDAAREQARTTVIVADLREIRRAVFTYLLDTNTYPNIQCAGCNSNQDPLQNALGVPGWNGPYYSLATRSHPWGGPYKWILHDANNDGIDDYMIQVDDDPIGGPNNGSQIPSQSLIKIDTLIDDGDLSTGDFQGNRLDTLHQAPGWRGTAVGEAVFVIWGE